MNIADYPYRLPLKCVCFLGVSYVNEGRD